MKSPFFNRVGNEFYKLRVSPSGVKKKSQGSLERPGYSVVHSR